MYVVSIIDIVDEKLLVPIKERFHVEALMIVVMNFEGNDINDYDEMINSLVDIGSFTYGLKSLF